MAEGADDIAEDSPRRKPPFLLLGLFFLVLVLAISNIAMYISYVVATKVATRETQTGEIVLEEEKTTKDVVLLIGDNKDKSFNAFIARGEDQSNLAVQMRISLGVSNPGLRGTLELNPDPIKDRILAYLSQKTKRDIIYSFQRNILGEELKEIVNAILERDMELTEQDGRITAVHVTKLLFITL